MKRKIGLSIVFGFLIVISLATYLNTFSSPESGAYFTDRVVSEQVELNISTKATKVEAQKPGSDQ